MNEGTINVLGIDLQKGSDGFLADTCWLEHYFEMSKYDAERALAIYKAFTKQTNLVVEFLSTARQYENATRLEIPKLKHAPTSLTSSLEEYLKDPDFEVNRRQYLAQQDAKRGKKRTTNGASESADGFSKLSLNNRGASKAFPEPKPAPQPAPAKVEAKGPAPDLIDFFDSIEQNQQPMASAPQQQMPTFQSGSQYQPQQAVPQQTGPSVPQQSFFPQNGQQLQSQNVGNFGSANPFGQPQAQQPMQQNLNGTGFGGYPQQPMAQQQDLFSSAPQNQIQFPPSQQQFNTGDPSFGPRSDPLQRRNRSLHNRPDRPTHSDSPRCLNPQELRVLPIRIPHPSPHHYNTNPPILSPATSPINPRASCRVLHSHLSRPEHKDRISLRRQTNYYHNKIPPSPRNPLLNPNNCNRPLIQSRPIGQGRTLSCATRLHLLHHH